MSEQSAFSLRVFFPSGDPEGLRFITKPLWTGQGIVFPRASYEEVRELDELETTGVYILWEYVPQGYLPRVYIGESDSLKTRLNHHNNNKDFWTHCVVFLSKDKFLDKANIRYLEARLVALAEEAKRCELAGVAMPKVPTLDQADKADAESYLRDMLLCLPVIGIHFFEKPDKPSKITNILHLRGKGVDARGFEGSSGFTVLAGSLAVKETAPAIPGHINELRRDLQKNGTLEDKDTFFEFGQDYTFGSPSAAAGVVLGGSVSGRTVWKKKRKQ